MSNDMRESYLALKKIAHESFFLPFRESVQRMMREHKQILAKYDEPSGPTEQVGPTVKDEMRESYFAIKELADDVIGKPVRVAKEMFARQGADILAKYEPVPSASASSLKDGDNKCPPGGSSGMAP
jgi:hypothetical protein